jgi:hypothetical protein
MGDLSVVVRVSSSARERGEERGVARVLKVEQGAVARRGAGRSGKIVHLPCMSTGDCLPYLAAPSPGVEEGKELRGEERKETQGG